MARRTEKSTGLEQMRRGIAQFLEGARAASGAGRKLATGGVPGLVARAWRDELLAGYRSDPAAILKPLATRARDGLVVARDIEFTSICRHHLLPFSGRAHLVYAPDGRITGLSRLGRLVDCLSRRLQLQESLTREIASAMQRHLRPAGAACVIEATHTCMTMRGARKSRASIVTSAFTGTLAKSASARREALAILSLSGPRRKRP